MVAAAGEDSTCDTIARHDDQTDEERARGGIMVLLTFEVGRIIGDLFMNDGAEWKKRNVCNI